MPTIKHTLLDNTFIKSSFLSEKGYVLHCWKSSTEAMEDRDFKNIIRKTSQKIVGLNCVGLLIDARNFEYLITPDIQEWHDQVIVPQYISSGVLKLAFLLPSDFHSSLSVEETLEEPKAQDLKIQFFECFEKAEAWLLA